MKKVFCEKVHYDYTYFSDDKEKTIEALKGVDLEINEGEFVSILGINGSGKSTLAKHLNGLYKPLSGVVYIDGINTLQDENIFEVRKYCGMVFQNPDNQIIGTIVEDDVAFGLENLGIKPNEIIKRINKSLEEVEMLEYKDKQPSMLSGGQKQRVSIAGVLAMEPKCIVFDEPTAMLDPVGRKKIMKIIKKLKDKGITIVLITHFMEEAIESDRIIVMNDGEVEMRGTPVEIFTQVEKIKSMGLEVPLCTEIAYELKKRGIAIKEDILTIEEMVGELCR